MRIPFKIFDKLPTSLLLTSLALAVGSLPVESVQLLELTPETFEKNVADGVWFVEHYSPYCSHCKQFAPMWEKLVEHYSSVDDPGVRLAQVNCAANGDLCNAHGVKGYPQMNLYKNGAFVENFKGLRHWDELTAFIDGYAVRTASKSAATQAQEKPAQKENTKVPPTKAPNGNGVVQPVDAAGLKSLIDEGPVFVKYYAPWCGHCKKLAPIWTQLASHLRHKLNVAEVNCDEHSALCKQQGVQGYPSLFFYSGGSGSGMHKTEYSGGRKFEQLRRFAEMAITPALLEVNDSDDYEHYVKESPVLYLFFHSIEDKQALDQLQLASGVLLGSPKILTSLNATLRSRFNIPAIHNSSPVLLSIKDGIPYSAVSVFPFPSEGSTGDAVVAKLSAWLLRNRLPPALALGRETFQDVMNAPHAPLVVLAAISPASEAEASTLIRNTAKAWRYYREDKRMTEDQREVVFAWMDAEKWAKWMKSMYGVKPSDLPAVVITDHQNLVYYDKDPMGHKIAFETQSILKTIEGVFEGKVANKHSENIFERAARYLNHSLEGLEKSVTAHPYRTGFFFVALLGTFVLVIKRFITNDMPSHSDYTRLQKAPNRLD